MNIKMFEDDLFKAFKGLFEKGFMSVINIMYKTTNTINSKKPSKANIKSVMC